MNTCRRLLFLNPYDRGSHADFARGWRRHSRHDIRIEGLPGRHWKWRMRHSAWTLSQRLRDEPQGSFDAVVVTDMLDLCAWRAFAPAWLARLPTVLYFHENQLTYPDMRRAERDLHFGVTNLLSTGAADDMWFNSAWHRQQFLEAATTLCERVPDHPLHELVERIASRSTVMYPGIAFETDMIRSRGDGPLHIVWASRWEKDKDPELFLSAITEVASQHACRVSVIGGQSSAMATSFAAARRALIGKVQAWGWLDSRADYEAVLRDADLIVSTAKHEFFGIAMVEAAAAGVRPLLPRSLAYPEVFRDYVATTDWDIFYDGSGDALRQCLAAACETGKRDPAKVAAGASCIESAYHWRTRAAEMDSRIEQLCSMHD